MNTPETSGNSGPTPTRRAIPLVAVFGVAVALVGFLLGIAEPEQVANGSSRTRSAAVTETEYPEAPSYTEMAGASFGPGQSYTSSLSGLIDRRPGVFDPVRRTQEMKLEAIADRARTRAFDGAPPVIPHPAGQQTASNCLACHGDGVRIGKRIATKMSHQLFSNCTQCHVETAISGPFTGTAEAENSFEGLYRAGPGDRVLAGSPPTIPHQTFLREDCTSCHGLVARPGLRTTHPWLSHCTQCHAPSAELDQAEFPHAEAAR